jgi:hypothetical protein
MFLLIMMLELFSNCEVFSHVSRAKRVIARKNLVQSLKGLYAPITRARLAPIQKHKTPTRHSP